MAAADMAEVDIWNDSEPIPLEAVTEKEKELADLLAKQAVKRQSLFTDEHPEEVPNRHVYRAPTGTSVDVLLAQAPADFKCVTISAEGWTSTKAAGDGLKAALGDSWMSGDLDNESAGKLFEAHPFIVIDALNEVSSLAIDTFVNLFWLSVSIRQQEIDEQLIEVAESCAANGASEEEVCKRVEQAEKELDRYPPLLILVGYHFGHLAYGFDEDDESLVEIPFIQ
mmetsp:Transcript_12962/g.39189  ORF Transcript_12962/g.39189 Transcript_12962/m.39189 type:complete len:225 (+) Transcript_12962:107-781(+)